MVAGEKVNQVLRRGPSIVPAPSILLPSSHISMQLYAHLLSIQVTIDRISGIYEVDLFQGANLKFAVIHPPGVRKFANVNIKDYETVIEELEHPWAGKRLLNIRFVYCASGNTKVPTWSVI